jgi:stage III sporulation protein AH
VVFLQAKKQTIWLVSMLSLMVVLSAYYLFTDDVKTSTNHPKWDQMVIDDVSPSSTPSTSSKKEEAIESSTTDYFANLQMERDEKQEAEFDRLMETMNNANEATAATTMKTLGDLQDQAEKVSALEEQLASEYTNAVVTQTNGKWDVTVQAKDLQKTQAVSIAELVMNELTLKPNQITIHTIKQ